MSEPAPKPKRRWRLALALVLAGVLGALFVALSPARLTPRVQGLVDRALPGRLELARVEWRPPLGVHVEELRLTHASGGPALLEIDRLDGVLDGRALLDGVIGVAWAEARGVRARLSRSSTAASYALVDALVAPSEPGPSSPGPPVRIEAFRIEDLSVTLDEPSILASVRGATVTAGRLEVDAEGTRLSVGLAASTLALARPIAVELEARSDVLGFAWDSARAAGTLSTEGLALELHGAPGAHVELQGELGGLATEAPEVTADARFELPMSLPAIAALLPEVLSPVGVVRGTARASGALLRPTITATVAATGLSALGQEIATARAQLRAEGGQLTAAPLAFALGAGGGFTGRATLDGGRFRVDGELASVPARELLTPRLPDAAILPRLLDGHAGVRGELGGTIDAELSVAGGGLALRAVGRVSPELALELSLAHAAPAAVFARYLPRASARSIAFEGALRGAPDRLQLAGVATAEGARYGELPPMSLRAPFTLHGDTLALDGATVSASVATARATGRVRLPAGARPAELELELEARDVALSAFSGGLLHGSAHASGTLRGTSAAPRVELQIGLGPTELRGLRAKPASLRLALDGRKITLEPARVELEAGGVLGLRGTLDEDRLEAQVSGDAIELAGLGGPSDAVALRGPIALELSIVGALADPTLDARIGGHGVSIGGAEFGQLGISARGPLGALELDALAFGLGGSVRASGTIDARAQRAALELVVRGLDLPELQGVPIDGRLDAELRVRGPFAGPEFAGTLALRELSYEGRALELPLLSAELATEGDEYRVRAELGRALHADLRLRLWPALDLRATVEAEALSLSSILPALAEREVDAVLSAGAELHYGAKGGLEAELGLTGLDIADAAGNTLGLAAPARARYTRGALQLDRLRLDGKRGWLELEGSAGDALDLRLSASVNASVLPVFVRSIQQASGRFRVLAAVRGKREAPRLDAALELDERVTLRPRTGPVREIVIDEAALVASPGLLEVRALSGQIAGGSYRASGTVALDGLAPERFDLSFDGSSLPLRTGDLALEANVALRLSGAAAEPTLSGEIEASRARYAKEFKLQNFAFVSAKSDEGPRLAELFPWLATLGLDLRVRSPGEIRVDVDANAIQIGLDLAADVRVRGTPLEPSLDGRVTADAGRLVFPKATLEVERAVVELDPFPPAGSSGVSVRLEAQGEVLPADSPDRTEQARLVTLVMSGPLEAIELELSSPGLDRLAVLSLLITGRAELDEEGALAFAGAELSRPITAFLEQQLEKALNLGLRLNADVGPSAVKLTVSKSFTQRLVLEGSYQRAFDQSGTVTTTVRALLFLFDRAFLEAATSQSRPSVVTPGQPAAGEARSTRVELKYQVLGR